MSVVTWTLTALSIVGVILNIYKRRSCFAVWMVTNGSWCVVDFYMGIPAQGAMFAIYFLLAVWGMWRWKG